MSDPKNRMPSDHSAGVNVELNPMQSNHLSNRLELGESSSSSGKNEGLHRRSSGRGSANSVRSSHGQVIQPEHPGGVMDSMTASEEIFGKKDLHVKTKKLPYRTREIADIHEMHDLVSNEDFSIANAWRRKHNERYSVAAHHKSDHELSLMASFEGLDYDNNISDVRMGGTLRQSEEQKRELIIARWLYTALIGMTTGFLGFVINMAVGYFGKLKYALTDSMILDGDFGKAYGIHLAMSLGFAAFSTTLVNYIEPVAAGSGIPEVKGYLNGSNYLRLLSLKALLVKFIGVMFSVSSGLVIGKEGPLIHIGSALGANYATLPGINKLEYFRKQLWPLRFRNDRDKRDFVSVGAAAGVAAAFGSPTGGICFALEEASSFWQLSLTWRTYFCTCLSTSVIWLFTAMVLNENSYEGFIKYGSPGNKIPHFQFWQLPWIGIPAILGGLVGALFCELNKRLTHWRLDHVIGRKRRQIAQVLIVVFLTVTLTFFMPKIYDDCREKVPNYVCNGYQNKYYCGSDRLRTPTEIAGATATNCVYECEDYSFYHQYDCNHNTQFSSTGTLSNVPWDDVIHALFHNEAAFSKASLFIYVIIIFFLANITYGIAVPSGLFVPCILMGAGIGRIQGEIMRDLYPYSDIHPGIWALFGAAGMLSGVTRITITITVILYETTNAWSCILPIMAIVIISKSIADVFNISLYDMHVEIKCIPFVEPAPPLSISGLLANEVMSTPLKTIHVIPTVHEVITLLRSCKHNGFPVIDDNNKLRGMTIRNHLITILKFYNVKNQKTKEEILAADASQDVDEVWSSLLPEESFAVSLQSKNQPLTETIEALMTTCDAESAIDLRPYMNRAPLFISEHAPILRAYGLVRGMGMRHIAVCNEASEPVGMITRKELMTDFKRTLV